MSHQLWELSALISGNFYLVENEKIIAKKPPFPYLRSLLINPEFDENGKQTGLFNFVSELEFKGVNDKLSTQIVADLGRDVFIYFIDLMTFLSGHPIQIANGPFLKYNYPNTRKYRLITFPEKQAAISPPISLTNTDLLTISMKRHHRRIISWLRKGLEERDVVNNFISLSVSLELIANQFEFTTKQIRTCSDCGFETELEPGSKQRVEHFLAHIVGYPSDKCKLIWETRNRLLHGAFSLTPETKRQVHTTRDDLLIAIVKGMKRLLSIPETLPPAEVLSNWRYADAILDVEYIEPDSE